MFLRILLPLCLVTAPTAGQGLSFAQPLDYPSSEIASVGDLTGDGRADVLTRTGNNYAVQVANVNGSLAAPVLSAGIGGLSGCIADVDGDGRRDIAFVFRLGPGCTTAQLRVGMNQGICAGSGPGPEIVTTTVPISAPGCFLGPSNVQWDGQGRMWIWETPGTTLWWMDVTPGALPGSPPTITNAGPWFANCGVVRDVVVCDLDGDSFPDIVLACSVFLSSTDATLYTFHGSALGPVLNPATPPISVSTVPTLNVCDIDADGKDDVLVANSAGVSVLRTLGQSGGGVTQSLTSVWSGLAARAIASDLDGDADDDVVVLSQSHNLSFLVNDGTGAFTLDTLQIALPVASSIATGDLDGNGTGDLVSTSPAGLIRVQLSTVIPLVEPRPGTVDGPVLETITVAAGASAQPISGPLGSVKRASPGTNITVNVIAPAFVGAPVVLGINGFVTGCPVTPVNQEIWLSFTARTFWGSIPGSGTYSLNFTVPASIPLGRSVLGQAVVLSGLALNNFSAITPAHEVQF